MSQGVPQVGGDEELAHRQRQIQMQSYLTNATLNAQRAMNQDNINDRQAGRVHDGQMAREMQGTYDRRSEDGFARMKMGQDHSSGMADREFAARLAEIGARNAGAVDLQRAGNEPEMARVGLDGRKYDDVSPAFRAEAQAKADRYGMQNSFLKQLLGGPAGANPPEGTYGPPVSSPGMSFSDSDRRKIAGSFLDIPGLGDQSPADAMLVKALAEQLPNVDPADRAAYIAAMRDPSKIGDLPAPYRNDPDATQLLADEPLGMQAQVKSFAERDTNVFGFDPNQGDVDQIVNHRDQMAQTLMRKHRMPAERARSLANQYINRDLVGKSHDMNSGWIKTLQQALGIVAGDGPPRPADYGMSEGVF